MTAKTVKRICIRKRKSRLAKPRKQKKKLKTKTTKYSKKKLYRMIRRLTFKNRKLHHQLDVDYKVLKGNFEEAARNFSSGIANLQREQAEAQAVMSQLNQQVVQYANEQQQLSIQAQSVQNKLNQYDQRYQELDAAIHKQGTEVKDLGTELQSILQDKEQIQAYLQTLKGSNVVIQTTADSVYGLLVEVGEDAVLLKASNYDVVIPISNIEVVTPAERGYGS